MSRYNEEKQTILQMSLLERLTKALSFSSNILAQISSSSDINGTMPLLSTWYVAASSTWSQNISGWLELPYDGFASHWIQDQRPPLLSFIDKAMVLRAPAKVGKTEQIAKKQANVGEPLKMSAIEKLKCSPRLQLLSNPGIFQQSSDPLVSWRRRSVTCHLPPSPKRLHHQKALQYLNTKVLKSTEVQVPLVESVQPAL